MWYKWVENRTLDKDCFSGDSFFEKFMEINTQLTFVLSVFPNLLVIYLAQTTRIRELRHFRVIIAAQSAVETFSSLILSTFQASMKNVNNMMVAQIRSLLLKLSIPLCIITYFAYAMSLMLSIFLPLTVFLYRYAFICRDEKVKIIFTTKGFTLWAIFTLCFNAIMVWRYSNELEIFVANGSNGLMMVTQFEYKQYELKNAMSAYIDVAHITLFFVAVIVAYSTVAYCANKTFHHVSTSAMQAAVKKVQKELNYAMVFQAILPLICAVFPIILYCLCIFGHINIGCGASVIIMFFNWQPCAHPLISLYFVAPFRKRLLDVIHCRKSQTKTAPFSLPEHHHETLGSSRN